MRASTMRLLVLTAFIGSFHLLLAQGLTVTRDKLGAEASELLHIIDSTGGHEHSHRISNRCV